MIKLLIALLFGLTAINIPAMDAPEPIDDAIIQATEQLQAAIVANDIVAAHQAFNNNAKFSYWISKEGTRSQRQVNALNFVIKHFMAGGENKQTASQILSRLDVGSWTELCAMEDGFSHQAPMEMLNSDAIAEIGSIIKRIHFNSDDDEEKYQQSLRLAAKSTQQSEAEVTSA